MVIRVRVILSLYHVRQSRNEIGGKGWWVLINPLLTTHIIFLTPDVIYFSVLDKNNIKWYVYNMSSKLTIINKINKKIGQLTIDDIGEFCAEAGITVSRLCVDLDKLLKATRTLRDNTGEYEVDDNNVRLKAVMSCLELMRLTGVKTESGTVTVQHQMAPGDISRLEAIAKELKGLEMRLVMDKIQQGVPVDASDITDAVISRQ